MHKDILGNRSKFDKFVDSALLNLEKVRDFVNLEYTFFSPSSRVQTTFERAYRLSILILPHHPAQPVLEVSLFGNKDTDFTAELAACL